MVTSSFAGNTHMVFWTVKEALSKALRTGFMSPLEIYELESMKIEARCWISEFKNFSQYQGRSFFLGHLIYSLVYPKNINLKVNNILLEVERKGILGYKKPFLLEQKSVAPPIYKIL